MPCNSPNRVFYIGINNETGKRKTLFTSRNVDFIYRHSPTSRWITAPRQNNLSPDTFRKSGNIVITDYDDVPCGQCLGCRLDYARQWSARIMAEKESYPDELCWFLTVTYDDDHLPEPRMIPDKIDEETGEMLTAKPSPFSSVSIRDHQLFMKRLRKRFQPKTNLPIRFFGCLEYGSISYRCHMHYIIFGLKLDDIQLYKKCSNGTALYTSAELQRCWCDKQGVPIGFITAGSVTLDSAGYCARYALKKRNITTKESYEKLGIDPECVVMSRRSGIGSKYFEDHVDTLYLTDEIILPGRDRAIKMKPPKYFDTLLESYDPELYDNVKQHRRYLADAKENYINDYLPFVNKEEQYKTKERKLEKKTKVLKVRNIQNG